MSDMHALEKQVAEAADTLKKVLDDYRFSMATRNTLWGQIDWCCERFFDEREKAGKGRS